MNNYDLIPQEMKEKKQWVLAINKIPFQPNGECASHSDYTTWSSFDDCLKEYESNSNKYQGIGYMFNNDLVGLDLDDCFESDGSTLKWWAKKLLKEAKNAFIEKTISQKGLHIYFKANDFFRNKPGVNVKLRKLGIEFDNETEKAGIEIYSNHRYFLMTANIFENNNTLNQDSYCLQYLYEMLKNYDEKFKTKNNNYVKKDENTVYDKVNNLVSIEKVIDYYNISRKGSFACCPFHTETKPSMKLYGTSFYCWGCCKGGDTIKFISEYEKISNSEAMEKMEKMFDLKLTNIQESLDKNQKIPGLYKMKSDRSEINPTNKEIKFIPFGIETIDTATNQLETKRVSLVSGRPGEGKTTLVEQIQNIALDKGFKVFRVDGEHNISTIRNNSYRKILSRHKEAYDIEKYNMKYRIVPKPDVVEALDKWHGDNWIVYSRTEGKVSTVDELFKMMYDISKVNDIDLIILDNLMSLLDCSSIEKNEKQADFMKRCQTLANMHNLHIILVAHPNKTAGKGQELDFFQISGASELINYADNVFYISREYDEVKLLEGISGYIAILKNRGYGDLKKIEVFYDKETSEIIERGCLTKSGINWFKYLPPHSKIKLSQDLKSRTQEYLNNQQINVEEKMPWELDDKEEI